MKSAQDFVVPWVKAAEPYSDKHMDVAWEHPQTIRMMSNENLLPPSKPVLDAILSSAQSGNLYPGSGPELRDRLGEAAGLTAEHVVLGDGSTDVINFVIHTFVAPGEYVLLPVPTFPMYAARVSVAGGRVISVPMLSNFYWDVDGLLGAVTAATKLIFICSPNNPTGNQIEERDLLRILDLGIPTFFDEAYYDLENTVTSRAPLIAKYPHMVVNRTMSKAFGLAGLRLGYLLCDPALSTYFNRVRIPWNVGVITLAAALAGLDDVDDQLRKRENIIQGRAYIYDEINKLRGLRAFRSEGNFVLIDASVLNVDSIQIRDHLAEQGIYIRPMSGHDMPKGFIRVTVGTPDQNRLFIRVFGQYVKRIRGI